MRKNKIISLTVALGLGMTLIACAGPNESGAGGEDETLDKVNFMLDVNVLPKHAIFYGGLEHGIYEKYGIDLEIRGGTGSLNTAKAVDSGQFDFGFADFGASSMLAAEGGDVHQISLVQALTAYATITVPESGITSWADLEGKTVGGETATLQASLWPAALEAAGLAPGAAELINVTGETKIPGLLAQKWDATIAFSISDVPIMMDRGIEPVVLHWADIGVSMYGNGLISAKSFAAENPDLVKRFVTATNEGVKWSCDNQEKAADALVKHVKGMSRTAAISGVEQSCHLVWSDETTENGLGYMSEEGVKQVMELTGDALGTDYSSVTPADLFTTEYLQVIKRDTEITL